MKLLQECDHNVQRAVDVVQEQGLPAGKTSAVIGQHISYAH